MTLGSIFTGIGAFDLGFERAGFSVQWQIEIDEYCRRSLERHFPNAERYADIRDCRNLPRVDVVTGGLPCQPYSSATRGRCKGTADTRNLWPEMRRIIQECKPAWVCIENVANFDRLALEQVASEMESDGYEVAPPLEIPACAVGQDHWRPRLWLLGYSHSNRESSRTVYAETSGVQRRDCNSGRMGAKNGIPKGVAMRLFGNALIPEIAQRIAESIKLAEPEPRPLAEEKA